MNDTNNQIFDTDFLNNLGVKDRIIEKAERILTFKNIFEETTWEDELNEEITLFYGKSNERMTFIGNNKEHKEFLKSNDIYSKIYNKEDNCEINIKATELIQKYKEWAPKQLKELQQAIYKDLNFNYSIKIQKYVLINNHNSYSQERISSKCVLMNNKVYTPLIVFDDIFLPNSIIDEAKDYFLEIPRKQPEESNRIVFSNKVIAKILNSYVSNFYGDNIYSKNSLYNMSDLGSNILPVKISISCLPYDDMVFDGEGILTSKKQIIQDGKLTDIISNLKYSQLLCSNSNGNADYDGSDNIKHQCLELDISDTTEINNNSICFVDKIFQNSYNIKSNEINAQIIYKEKNNKYICGITINLDSLFREIKQIGKKQLCDNVLCSDVFFNNIDSVKFT